MGEKSCYIFSLNLVYNFLQDKKIIPFILAGAGPANQLIGHNINSSVIYILVNAGAGLKLFTSNRFAVQLEYRFQYNDGRDVTISINGTKTHVHFIHHSTLIGISFFLK